jgi:hypothetical protein
MFKTAEDKLQDIVDDSWKHFTIVVITSLYYQTWYGLLLPTYLVSMCFEDSCSCLFCCILIVKPYCCKVSLLLSLRLFLGLPFALKLAASLL